MKNQKHNNQMKQTKNKDITQKRNNNQPSLIPPSASVDGRHGGGGDVGKSTNSPWKTLSWHWFDDIDGNQKRKKWNHIRWW